MNGLLAITNHPLAHRLGWALLHSLWQGALVALTFAFLRLALRRCSANARYLAGCGMLFLLAAAPVATFLWAPVPVPATPPGLAERGYAPGNSVMVARSGNARAFDPLTNAPQLIQQVTARLEAGLPWLVAAWLAGVVVFSCRWLQGCWWVRRIKTVRTEPLDVIWLQRLGQLKWKLGISRPVCLLKSALVEVPVVVGWLRPVILLPASVLTGLTPGQMEAILAHELAHVRRCDYLVNAFQNLVETVMFYHPAAWWVSRCVREEREHCCDDLVVRVCGDRLGYARALVTLEELRGMPAQVAFAASGGSLLRRIRRLLGLAGEDRPVTIRDFAGFALMGLGCLLMAAGLTLLLGAATYQATCRIKVERDLPGQPGSADDTLGTRYYDPYFIQTEFEIIQSPVVLNRAIRSLQSSGASGQLGGLDGKPVSAEALAGLRRHIRLRPVRNTSLVEVQAFHDSPTEAARIANAVAAAYREYREQRQRSELEGAIKVTYEKVFEQEQQVRESQRNVEDLRLQLQLPEAVPIGQESNGTNSPTMLLTAETLRRVETLRIESKADLVRQKTLLNKLKELNPDALAQAIPTTGIQDQLLMALMEQRALAEQRLIPLAESLGSQHPDVKAATAQVEDLTRKINERIKGFMVGLEVKVASLEQSLGDLEKEVGKAVEQDMARARETRPYWEAKRKLEERERFRNLLYVRLSSDPTNLALRKSSLVEIVEEAIPPLRPFSPNRPRSLALLTTGLLSMLTGLVLVRRGETVASASPPRQ